MHLLLLPAIYYCYIIMCRVYFENVWYNATNIKRMQRSNTFVNES